MNKNKKQQNSRRQPYEQTGGHTDRHIILSLRGFEPLACGHMHALRTIMGHMKYLQKATQTTGQRERGSDRYRVGRTDGLIYKLNWVHRDDRPPHLKLVQI